MSVLGLVSALFTSWGEDSHPENFPVPKPDEAGGEMDHFADGTELTTFGSGCFCCPEAGFLHPTGMRKVTSGWREGSVRNLT